jgi:hypothetical protein
VRRSGGTSMLIPMGMTTALASIAPTRPWSSMTVGGGRGLHSPWRACYVSHLSIEPRQPRVQEPPTGAAENS